jgi:hypothetical protein
VVAALLSLRLIERDRRLGGAPGPDVHGDALVTAGLMLAVFTIVDESGSVMRLGLAVLAAVLLAAFVVRQRVAAEQLVRLGIFRSVSGGNLIQLLMVTGMLGFQFTATLYLQRALGYAPAQTGIALLPIPVTIAVVSLAWSWRRSYP